MPGKTNRILAASALDSSGLIFPWTRKYPGIFWLWGFLVLSLLLHVTGFYLFQVVYPSSGRVEPFPARVLILDSSNPDNASLLQELNDRLVFLRPASEGSESRKNVDDFSVSFKPSFVNRVPLFRKPGRSQNEVDWSLPRAVSLFPPFSIGGSADLAPATTKLSDKGNLTNEEEVK